MSELKLAPVDPADVYEDAERPEVGPAWQVRTLGDADWCLERMAALEREQRENTEAAEERIEMIRARNENLNARLARGVEFFRRRLQTFADAHRDELLMGGKKKSRALMHGSIGWRKAGGGLVVKDEAALLEWARKQPVEAEVLRVTEAPAIGAIKALFRTTGEVPPGADVEPERDEFQVKTEGGK